jgi:hypothetical protein
LSPESGRGGEALEVGAGPGPEGEGGPDGGGGPAGGDGSERGGEAPEGDEGDDPEGGGRSEVGSEPEGGGRPGREAAPEGGFFSQALRLRVTPVVALPVGVATHSVRRDRYVVPVLFVLVHVQHPRHANVCIRMTRMDRGQEPCTHSAQRLR